MLSKTWFEILSDLFINLAAGWFMVVLIEPQVTSVKNIGPLIFRFSLGILSLMIAKIFKEESK